MVIQAMLYVFIAFFVFAFLSFVYFLYYSMMFRLEIKKCNPNKHPIIKLGQDIYVETQDPLDNMGKFQKLRRFNKEIKESFPTGEVGLDRSYKCLKKAEMVLSIAFIFLITYSVIFVAVMFLVYGNE